VPTAAGLLDAGRERLAQGRARLRDSAWSVGQCTLAGGLAWAAAEHLLGHVRPFFAVVAAVVCLGVRAAQRLRRVGELAVGVTVGVAVGDLLVGLIGAGAWQVSLVVGIALLLAVALDGGPLLVAQSGLQAVFVVALPRTPGSGLARWEDALIGGATALLVAALLPADPWRAGRRQAEESLRELATAVRCCARALRARDPAEAEKALGVARGTQPGLQAWSEALTAGREITRLSPWRRGSAEGHDAQERLQVGVDRAARNVRVLVRRVLFALETDEPLPEQVAEELDAFAEAIGSLHRADGPPQELLRLAAELDPEELGVHGLNATVVVGQLRSAVVDLLVAVGVAPARAREALPPAS